MYSLFRILFWRVHTIMTRSDYVGKTFSNRLVIDEHCVDHDWLKLGLNVPLRKEKYVLLIAYTGDEEEADASLDELEELDEGTVFDMIVESANDNESDSYKELATQADFDRW